MSKAYPSVKTAAMVSDGVGDDAGKKIKGRKRFITVEALKQNIYKNLQDGVVTFALS